MGVVLKLTAEAGTKVDSARWGMFNRLVSHILLGLDNSVVPCWGYILADSEIQNQPWLVIAYVFPFSLSTS